MRYYLKTHNIINLFNHEEMVFRVQTTFDEFSQDEKIVLQKIVYNNYQFTPKEAEALNFLQVNGVVNKENNPQITVPVLSDYIQQIVSVANKLLINDDGKLYINTVNIDHFFSRREKQLLKFLLLNINQLLTRNKAANLLWSNNAEEKYTDWALDQAIKRLRIKLEKLGIKNNLIKTIKNQGFMIIN